mgnify:CR=1 FL=1
MINNSLIKKVKKALSYRFLIGDINFSDKEKEEIINEFLSIYKIHSCNDWKNRISNYEVEVISITLIIAAKNYPNDWQGKDFWNKIADSINVYSTDLLVKLPLPYNNVLDEVRRLLTDDYHNHVFFNSKTGRTQYAQSIMFQAYAPKNSIKAFIMLAWSFFCSVFSFEYNDKEDRNTCNLIIDRLALGNSQYSDLESDIEIGGKFYQIRAALKYGFEQDKISSVLLLRRILFYINDIYTEKKDLSIVASDDYLAGIVLDVMKSILTPFIRKRGKRRYLPKAKKIEEIKPHLFLNTIGNNDNQLELVTNSISLSNGFLCKRNATLSVWAVLNNNKIGQPITCSKPIISSDFLPTIDELKVDVYSLLRIPSKDIHLHLEINVDGEIIYQNNIQRDFILFKGKNEVIGDCKPGTYMIFFSNRFNLNECLNVKNNCEHISNNSAIINTQAGDAIITDNCHTFFTNSSSEINGIFGNNTIDTGLRAIYIEGVNESEYTILKSVDYLLLHADKEIDYKNFSISDFSEGNINILDISESNIDNKKSFKISLSNLKKYYRHTLDVNLINNDGSKKNLGHLKFIIDPLANFKLQNDKPMISYGADSAIAKWRFFCYEGNKIVISGKDKAIINLSKNDNENADEIQFLSDKDEKFDISNDLKDIYFEVPYFKWAIDEGEFQVKELGKPIWYGDIYSNELIHVDSNICFSLYVDKEPLPKVTKNEYYQLSTALNKITEHGDHVVKAITKYKNRFQELKLFSIIDTPILQDGISCQDLFAETDEGLKVLLSNFYCGPSNTEFKIVFTPLHYFNKKYFFTGRYCENWDFPILDGLPDNEYEVKITIEYDDPYSSDKKTSLLIVNNDIALIGSENSYLFDGVESLKFKKYRCPDGSQQRFKKVPIYITDIHFVEEEELPLYKGKMKIAKSKSVDVYFKAKTNKNIILCYKDRDGFIKNMSSNADGSSFFSKPSDDKNYFVCHSIYCEVE